MDFSKSSIAILFVTAVQASIANDVTITIAGISSMYPQVDTMNISFDDSLGAVSVPYWLNGFVSSNATTGYIGTLHSTITSYQAQVYVRFTPGNDFYLFQECSLTVKCYLALATPTNSISTTINPRSAGQLAAYFQENIGNLSILAGSNAGWNVSYNSLPNFPESFPWLQVVKPSEINISAVPEVSTLLSFILGGTMITILRGRSIRRAGA